MSNEPLRQILYTSLARGAVDVDAITQQSRHNNALDGVTGLLWFDGARFLQVLEGPETSVLAVVARIRADGRHDHFEILSDRAVETREFGYWSMENRRDVDLEQGRDALLDRRLANAPEVVRNAFLERAAG